MTKHKLKINGVQYKTFFDLIFGKVRNYLGSAEFTLYGVLSTDYTTNINYNKLVTIEEWDGSSWSEVWRGYVRDVSKTSYRKSKVFCYTPGIHLYDRTWSTRQEYTNTATDTILSAIASGIMDVGTNSISNVITTRFEVDNKLKSVAQLANINGGEWWTDTGPTLNDRINLATSRYSDTSVKTLTVGTNCSIAEDKTDYDKVFNCITVLGRGDGINQVKATTYGFCYYTPDTTSAMSATSTSVTVDSSAGMASSNGIIYINNEKILYGNRTGNNLYNLTRGYDGTTAVAHSSGMRVWYAGTTSNEYTKDNPATNSSVDTYGIREYTYPDKGIVRNLTGDPDETAGKVGRRLFDRFHQAIRTITIRKMGLLIGDLDVGKVITVVDSMSGLNGDFKIYKLTVNIERGKARYLEIEANNLMYNFSTKVEELEKNMDTTNMYGQGATNIFQVNLSENVDNPSTPDKAHPMNLRFYMPEEAVAVNSVKLNFKMKNYRADSTSVNVAPKFQTNQSTWSSGGLAWLYGDFTKNTFISGDTIEVGGEEIQYPVVSYAENALFEPSVEWTDCSNITSKTYVGPLLEYSGTAYAYPIGDGNSYVGAPSWSPVNATLVSHENTSAISGLSFTKEDVVNHISWARGDAYTNSVRLNWGDPLSVSADAPDITDGDFDRIIITFSVNYGHQPSSPDTVKFYLLRKTPSATTFPTTAIETWTHTFENLGDYFTGQYETTGDYRGYGFRVAAYVGTGLYEWDVNKDGSDLVTEPVENGPDESTMSLTVSTYLSSTNDLNYGIYENTSEFTPPGTVTVEVGEDGGSMTTVGTYNDDQEDLTLSDSIDFEKGTWYNVRITPSTSGCPGGRMRIEAIAACQVYIESTVV